MITRRRIYKGTDMLIGERAEALVSDMPWISSKLNAEQYADLVNQIRVSMREAVLQELKDVQIMVYKAKDEYDTDNFTCKFIADKILQKEKLIQNA